jgi:hypothetical protein
MDVESKETVEQKRILAEKRLRDKMERIAGKWKWKMAVLDGKYTRVRVLV